MNLNDVNRGITKFKKRRRIGRGVGSGHGKTAGRGHKGQKSCPGYGALSIFQGGATPLVRRIPKRGFNNKFAVDVAVVNLGDLDSAFNAGDEVTLELLREKDLAKSRYDILKILGDGELTKKLKVCGHRFSASAREKIEKAGGEVVVLPAKITVAEKKKQAKSRASSG
ncbi:MAG: 50S ribosomal protein L15 [Planctomycetota bacterium]